MFLHGATETTHVLPAPSPGLISRGQLRKSETVASSAVFPDPLSPQTHDSQVFSLPESTSPLGLTCSQLEGGEAGQLRTQTGC